MTSGRQWLVCHVGLGLVLCRTLFSVCSIAIDCRRLEPIDYGVYTACWCRARQATLRTRACCATVSLKLTQLSSLLSVCRAYSSSSFHRPKITYSLCLDTRATEQGGRLYCLWHHYISASNIHYDVTVTSVSDKPQSTILSAQVSRHVALTAVRGPTHAYMSGMPRSCNWYCCLRGRVDRRPSATDRHNLGSKRLVHTILLAFVQCTCTLRVINL